MRRLGAFFLFKCLNYIILFIYLFIYFFFFFWGGGVFRNVNIFGGMKILWIYFFFLGGGHDKIGLVLGVSSMFFRVCSYGKCTE